MKILFTGGGTGGHFYPIIAVAEAVQDLAKEKKILNPELYYMAPTPYNPKVLFDNGIEYIRVPAGKIRRYFSLLNFTDLFKTLYGCLWSLYKVYSIYPDVVFGKGGYASFPTLLAAKILNIPVIIHESDSKPGKVNAWAGKFAKRIALSYPSAIQYFSHKDRVAYTGNPIRESIMEPLANGAKEFLNLEDNVPTVLILGGSQGSKRINDVIIEALPELLRFCQVIHQTGKNNIDEIKELLPVVLQDHPQSYRYHPFDYLNELSLRMSAGISDVVISRAGSTIFEIAVWGLPSIIIPLPSAISHDQTSNALSYTRTGAGSIIEENNLTANIIMEEIRRIIGSKELNQTMRNAAHQFARKDSARVIANAILDMALEHER